MTRKQFDERIRRFCILVKKKTGQRLGEKYVRDEIFKYYALYRKMPKLGMHGFNMTMK